MERNEIPVFFDREPKTCPKCQNVELFDIYAEKSDKKVGRMCHNAHCDYFILYFIQL